MKRGFVISMDLMLAIFMILMCLILISKQDPQFESDYPVASGALAIIQKGGWSTSSVELNQTLYEVLPYTKTDLSIRYYQPGNHTNNTEVARVLTPTGIAEFEGDVTERIDVVLDGDWVSNFAILRLEVQE